MFKMFMIAIAMVGFVGCAAKATTPTVQQQLDAHVATVQTEHDAMAAKNAEQDAAISEINARLDRGFRKGN
jgi:outer membrane lipoprotein-sorting protein